VSDAAGTKDVLLKGLPAVSRTEWVPGKSDVESGYW